MALTGFPIPQTRDKPVQLKQRYDFDFDHPHAVQLREVLLKGFTDPVTMAQINLQTAHAENN